MIQDFRHIGISSLGHSVFPLYRPYFRRMYRISALPALFPPVVAADGSDDAAQNMGELRYVILYKEAFVDLLADV